MERRTAFHDMIEDPVLLSLPEAIFHRRALSYKLEEYQSRLRNSELTGSRVNYRVLKALLNKGILRSSDIVNIRDELVQDFPDSKERLEEMVANSVELMGDYTTRGESVFRGGTGLKLNFAERLIIKGSYYLRKLKE